MNRIYIFAFALMVIVSCQTAKQEDRALNDSTATDSMKNEVTYNVLTPEQEAEGWVLLFNGQDTTGWRFFKNKENNSWEVVDGTLHCKPSQTADKRADIMTTSQYENFQLAFDWKVAPKANSGVMYRVTEEFDDPYLSGPEYQVIDDNGNPDAKPVHTTGANYDMHAPGPEKSLRPTGEWNSSKIVVNGNHVEHWLNGAKVLEYEFGSEEWKKLKNASKWKDAKGYGMAKKGHIDFQDHGDEVWYRNIMIRTVNP